MVKTFPEIVQEKVRALNPSTEFSKNPEMDKVWGRRRWGSRIRITRQVMVTNAEFVCAFVSGGEKRQSVIEELNQVLGEPQSLIGDFVKRPKTTFLAWPASRLS
jgi:hypothetical protein